MSSTVGGGTRGGGVGPIEQVRLLTRGLDLPLPPLNQRLLQTIAQGFVGAWEYLLNEHAEALLDSDESPITTLMCTRLNALIVEDHKWGQIVQKVTRGEETVSFNGASLEKRPDLSLKLTNRIPNFPLIVECKLMGPRKGIGLYCRKGLSRFLDGEYAWAAREGFMLAYVRDKSTLDDRLMRYLAGHRAKKPDPFATSELPLPVAGVAFEMRRSVHGRDFRYPERSPGQPGSIALWHLWLYRANTSPPVRS